MGTADKSPLQVNGRTYAWPDQPLVVVCIDGSEPAYMEQAMADGAMPYLTRTLEQGADLRADCVVPSFTNPNNLSIVTGAPPAVHGINGNFFLDPESGEEVMMNDPRFLRAPTILKTFQDAGAAVAVVTAKDKLRRLLGHGLAIGPGKGICLSAEKSDQATLADNGIEAVNDLVEMETPSVYSAELSEFVFAAGVEILARHRPDFLYLSTTDYVQHKHAPGTPAATDFYRMMDSYWECLDDLGATLALTADHGMNAKHGADGLPQVIYLQTLLDDWIGAGRARVILPITDPYVVHHGALGGYATAYLPDDIETAEIVARLAALDAVEAAMDKETACTTFGLPPDRSGDIVVVSVKNWTIGASADRHDLSALKEPLRSHGGISEQQVPLIFNRPIDGLVAERRLRNFDIYDIALNHVRAEARQSRQLGAAS
jgi:phosphonoacetate hydrolase